MKKYYIFPENKVIVYDEWDKVKALTSKFHENPYGISKLFESAAEAEKYLKTQGAEEAVGTEDAAKAEKDIPALDAGGVFSFVDGSYNIATKTYGYGGFLSVNGEKYYLYGSNNDSLASMRNVAGEIAGSMAAIDKAIELGLKSIVIYYDYLGIEKWTTGGADGKKWKAKEPGTMAYVDHYNKAKEKIDIKFSKVAAHTGIEGNEIVDRLAKYAVGNDLSQKDLDAVKSLLAKNHVN